MRRACPNAVADVTERHEIRRSPRAIQLRLQRMGALPQDRRIGMSGGLFTRAVAREIGREITPHEAEALQRRHGELFREFLPERRALPGAVELLRALREARVPY